MSVTATDDRFWSKVDGADPLGCWLWTGAAPSGYGTFYAGGGVSVYAHRYAYTAMVGPIPDGLHLDHTCQTPRCVKLKERVESIIDAKVEEQFAAMLGGRPATAFSEAVPAKTLEEYIGERVQAWLNQATGDSYSRDRKSRLEQALGKLLDRELTKALDDTMADARRKALDAVAGVAQDKLAEALRQSISQIAKG